MCRWGSHKGSVGERRGEGGSLRIVPVYHVWLNLILIFIITIIDIISRGLLSPLAWGKEERGGGGGGGGSGSEEIIKEDSPDWLSVLFQ